MQTAARATSTTIKSVGSSLDYPKPDSNHEGQAPLSPILPRAQAKPHSPSSDHQAEESQRQLLLQGQNGRREDTKALTAAYPSELTQKTIGDNDDEIQKDLKQSEVLGRTANCLRRHAIQKNLRAKMVNWMVEVLTVLGTEEQTFFKAVGIMDLYYACNRRYLLSSLSSRCGNEHLHLTGITAMLLASKLEDPFPIRIELLAERVAQGCFTPEEIREREREMLGVLHFDITFATVHDFLEHFLTELVTKSHPASSKTALALVPKLREYGLFYAMMAGYDYQMLSFA